MCYTCYSCQYILGSLVNWTIWTVCEVLDLTMSDAAASVLKSADDAKEVQSKQRSTTEGRHSIVLQRKRIRLKHETKETKTPYPISAKAKKRSLAKDRLTDPVEEADRAAKKAKPCCKCKKGCNNDHCSCHKKK